MTLTRQSVMQHLASRDSELEAHLLRHQVGARPQRRRIAYGLKSRIAVQQLRRRVSARGSKKHAPDARVPSPVHDHVSRFCCTASLLRSAQRFLLALPCQMLWGRVTQPARLHGGAA